MTPAHEKANEIMLKANFGRDLMLQAQVWAAKNQVCVKCKQPKNSPCHNLAKRRMGVEKPTVWPHPERVDWEKLVAALRTKGYER